MFKVKSIEIDGVWHDYKVACRFNDDVNVIIGRNGTGKTTFIQILQGVLNVDVEELGRNYFDNVKIVLNSKGQKITIKVNRIIESNYNYDLIEYQIDLDKYTIRVLPDSDPSSRVLFGLRRRIKEETEELRVRLQNLVRVSSISVHRINSDYEYEVRDKHGRRVISPVDFRLSELLRGFNQYQLELSQEARKVATELQKEVLASILYSEGDSKERGYELEFNLEKERASLLSAYDQLGADGTDIKKKINFHVDSINKVMTAIKNETFDTRNFDVRSLEAYRKTRKIIDLSLKSRDLTSAIFSQMNLFLEIVRKFIHDKKIEIDSGRLVVQSIRGEIEFELLSSGEKQLLIILIEALLQKKSSHVFIADEPELSLHIEWQRNIIPAVQDLNPNAQIIVATHSPEVAAKYPDRIFDMEDMRVG